jgi:hypothetical protein
VCDDQQFEIKSLFMKKITTKISMLGLGLFLASCSPKLTGTWTVQRYESAAPGQNGIAVSNIGTMTFKRNGSGEKMLNFQALGVRKDDRLPFTWKKHAPQYITIDGKGSDFSKTWIILENKRKFQKWTSTDGSNTVQVLELVK